MIKYQLERIKDMYSGISDPDILDGIPVVTVAQSDIEWLIEQAERVQELEEERDEWKNTAQSYYMTNQELREQNKRYREAIEKAIGGCRYTNSEVAYILQKALEGEE